MGMEDLLRSFYHTTPFRQENWRFDISPPLR
jgi:hypothetical protein